jgi:hypothetical protein
MGRPSGPVWWVLSRVPTKALGFPFHLLETVGQHHAAGLAARPGVDLGLDHPALATQFIGGRPRLAGQGDRQAARHRDAMPRKQALRLVFM